MGKDDDKLFITIAQEKKLLTEGQIRELREAIVVLKKIGIQRTASQIAPEKKMLSPGQLSDINREMRKRGVLPRFGGYEVISKLGEGGMGAVYKARHVALDRIVALKVLPGELARDKDYVKRFEREARLAAKVSHPNLIQVYDVGQSAGRRYIAMEFVGGSDVTKLLESGALDEARALEIVLGVARGLAAAHEQGIVHRDVKPSNIMLSEKGVPKLSDLGLARDIGSGRTMVTRTGLIMGTPQYMAPEQCRSAKDIDGRADIYSLGATLFHMVCNRVPFQGDSTLEIVQKHISEALPDLKELRPGLSDGLVALVQRMMEKDREKRFRNCRQLIAAIEALRSEAPSSPAPEPSEPSPSPPESGVPAAVDLAVALAEEERAAEAAASAARESGSRRRRPGIGVYVIAAAAVSAIVITVLAFWKGKPTPSVQPDKDVPRSVAKSEQRGGEAGSLSEKPKRPTPGTGPRTAEPKKAHTTPKAAALPADVLPRGWAAQKRRVKVATPEGDHEKEITYYKNSIGMEFALIPPGEFMMGLGLSLEGASQRYRIEEHRYLELIPQHRVRITNPYYMGAHEVTNGQYRRFVNESGYDGGADAPKNYLTHFADWGVEPTISDHPIVWVSWLHAQAFCQWLSRKESMTYRLPTEAEWEYACRAGTKTPFYWGKDFRADCAWYHGIWSAANIRKRTNPVGGKLPNGFGLFGMSGNVEELCADWHGNYAQSPVDDPRGPVSGPHRVRRGGSWFSREHWRMLSALRAHVRPEQTGPDVGFRVAVPVQAFAVRKSAAPSSPAKPQAAPASGKVAPTRALVAHYTFDEGEGAILKDHSGNGNDGTIHGATWVKRGNGYALQFDGTDDYVECRATPSLNIEKSGAVMLWYKPEMLQGGLVTRTTGPGWTDQRLALGFRKAYDLIWCLADENEHVRGGLWLPPPGRWSHLTMTIEDTLVKVYQDGSLTYATAIPMTPGFATLPMMIGRGHGLVPDSFKGLVDEVRIYSRPLSEGEVRALYQATADQISENERVPVPPPREFGPVAHYTFDEGVGTVLKDSSAYGNDGSIHGATWTKCGKGYALQFDGRDDYVMCEDTASLRITGGPMTIMAWVRPEVTDNKERGIVGKCKNVFGLTCSEVRCWWYTFRHLSGYSGIPSIAADLATRKWQHICGTFDGKTTRLHINGTVRNSMATGPLRIEPGKNLLMGCFVPDPRVESPASESLPHFKGMIDEVRIYRRALNAPEIQSLYGKDAPDHRD